MITSTLFSGHLSMAELVKDKDNVKDKSKDNEAINKVSESKQACSLSKSTWFVYLLRCADDTLYCGVTTNLEKRLRQHNGELVGGAKYTKVRRPCVLVYTETSQDRRSATQREYAIKQLTRKQKFALINA